jgi:hypothetical protein
MPDATIFWTGVITGALILAAVQVAFIWLLCRQAKPMDEEVA